MKIRPLFKWFGSKWQSAKHYPPPEHDRIVEPFAGGAGYSLNYCDRTVWIAEKDPNLIRLWRYLIGPATSQDVLDIPLNLPVGTDINSTGLEEGQKLLLKHWQRTNNVGDCMTISPWGHKPGQWTANTRARVAEEIHAVKHWKMFVDFDWPSFPATWFIDPPYEFNYRYRKGLPAFNHSELARRVGSILTDSLVIVCEATDPKTGNVPSYLPFTVSHRSVTSRRKPDQSHHSNELVYVRGRRG